MVQLNKEEQRTLENIKATLYMQKTIALIDDFINDKKQKNIIY
jgi:hypothetical protein